MADQRTPDRLPANFDFSKPVTVPPPDRLPADFNFEEQAAKFPAARQSGSRGFVDSFIGRPSDFTDSVKGLWNTVRHPIDSARAMGQQTIDLAGSAKDAFARGDILGSVRRGINAGINLVAPGLGASSEGAGQQFDEGNYGGGFGSSLALAGATALGAKTPTLARGAAETVTPGVTGPVGRLFRADPRTATTRAIRPVPSDPGFSKRIPGTLARIREANGGEPPAGVTDGTIDLLPAVRRTIEQTQGALEPWMQRAEGVRISGGPMIEATRRATEGMLPSERGGAEALLNRATLDYGGEFTPTMLRDRLHLLNERLSPFYDKSPAKQSSALADIPEAVLKAQRDAVADSLYRALDPEGAGSGPRMIQNVTGDLIDFRDAAMRRNNAIVAEQPVSVLGRIMSPVKGLISDILPSRIAPGMSFVDAPEGRSLPLVRRAFNAVKNEPVNALPRPGQPFYPSGDPGRLLGAGDLFTEPPADTSGIRIVDARPKVGRDPKTGRGFRYFTSQPK